MSMNITASKDRSGESKQPMVTLYFIGVNLMRGTDKKTPPTIVLGGHGAKRMPQIGGEMTVPANVARIIEKQTTTWHPETFEIIPGVTTNKAYAETVKAAYESGKPLNQEIAERAVDAVPDSVLRALYEKRFGPVDAAPVVDEKEKNEAAAPEDGEIVMIDALPETDEADSAPKKKAGRPAKGDS